jgi:undecaprenyl-diphosphatase
VSTVFGLFITKITESFRYNTKTSAISLILLGIVMVFIEKIKNKRNKIDDMKSLSWKQNFFIGTMQSFSMIPGVSRSGVTICAGLFTNMTKEASIQYSFFVSVFINILSCIFDTRNSYDAIKSQQFSTVFIIFILNFIFSLFFIKKVLNFLLEVRLKFFGYYRVIIGLLMLLVL